MNDTRPYWWDIHLCPGKGRMIPSGNALNMHCKSTSTNRYLLWWICNWHFRGNVKRNNMNASSVFLRNTVFNVCFFVLTIWSWWNASYISFTHGLHIKVKTNILVYCVSKVSINMWNCNINGHGFKVLSQAPVSLNVTVFGCAHTMPF